MMYDCEFGLHPMMREEDFKGFFDELDKISEGYYIDKYLTVHAEFDLSRTTPAMLKALVNDYQDMVLDSIIPEV